MLVSKNGGLQNGQLFTYSLLAASLVCSSPALAERPAHTADLAAYSVASYQTPVRVAYSPRERLSRAMSLQLRGNACLQSALAVERLPVSSRSMQDILDHCGLLGDDMQSGAFPQPASGKESSTLPVLVAAAAVHPDPQVHANNCTSCHSGY
jgi:cytochrome c